MAPRNLHRVLLSLAMVLLFAAHALAQGVELKSSATCWSGAASTCSQPSTVRFATIRDATPEWKTIRSEGVKSGSARYSLLTSQMNDRIRAACQKVAEDEARDCVVNQGDIKVDNGLTVTDITSSVVQRLESGQAAS